MKKIQVMLVDDHSVVRMGLAAIINLEKDIHVCGEAENGADAMAIAAKLKPDVIVMDLRMPGMDGADATAEVLKASPISKVLILTSFGDSADIAHALAAGATGAVTKNISNSDIADAIRRAAAGERILSPEIKASLANAESDKKIRFTKREQDIISSVTRGLTNQEIATMLNISRTRVKQHLKEVFNKLGAANRSEAIVIAMRKRLLNP